MKNEQEYNYLICYEAKIGNYANVAGDLMIARETPILTSDDVKTVRGIVKDWCVNDIKNSNPNLDTGNLNIVFRSINKLT
jgi:hypothetical protein